jgi:hypothetical protein
MIKKLYNLKKLQTDQKVSQKLQVLNNVKSIDEEIDSLKDSLLHTSVNRYGPVSDFAVLEIHKATMKEKIYKLEIEKSKLLKIVAMLDKEIVELQKESEQFKYILNEEKKAKVKKFLKEEDNKADEYVQSKLIMLTKE